MEHKHEHTDRVVHRLSKVMGHMEAVKRMVLEGRECSEILIQIAAIKSAINNVGKLLLKDHIDHCIVHAIESGDTETIAALHSAIDTFVR